MEEIPAQPKITAPEKHKIPGPEKLVAMVDKLFKYEPLSEPKSSKGQLAAESTNRMLSHDKAATASESKELKQSLETAEISPTPEKSLQDMPETYFDRHEVIAQEPGPQPSVPGSGMSTVGQVLTNKRTVKPPDAAPPLLPPPAPSEYWQEPARLNSPIYMYRKPLIYGLIAGLAASMIIIIGYFR